MERIYLADMIITRDRFRWITTDGHDLSVPYDGNLGHLMAGVSCMAKQLAGLPAATEARTNETAVDEMVIEGLTVAPYRFRLILTSGPHRFTCNLDRDLEHILAGFGAAMRFFALKTQRIVIEEDVSRNTERARETGLYTAPEGSA